MRTMELIKSSRAVALSVSLGLVALGCDSDFLPESYLNGLRVLALVPTPAELGPTDVVTVKPNTYLPKGEVLASSGWSFCPFSAGAVAGFACAVPACEVPLVPAADGSVSATPLLLAAACATRLSATGGAAGELPDEIPERVEVLFRYSAVSSSGDRREAVARVPLWTASAPASPNRHPVIQRVELGGKLATAGSSAAAVKPDDTLKVRVVIDVASLDTFTDAADRQRTEQPVVSFYATAGRFEYDRESGADVAGSWKAEQLEAGQTVAWIYVVVRDLRGGQAVAGPFVVPIS